MKRRKVEKLRREFSANVSHELKTPLTNILGYAEMLDSGLAAEADRAEFIRTIRSEAERMIGLVDDIMLLSHLDEGYSSDAFASVDLGEVVLAAADALQAKAARYEVELTVDPPKSPLVVEASASLLAELFHNLIDNAIKYNRPGGTVTVSAAKESGRAVARVADTGLGIPAKETSRVFERFYRVDHSRSKLTGGTGLGLAITKHIAQVHDADITLTSKEGVGTTIKVAFPSAIKGRVKSSQGRSKKRKK